MDIKNNTLSKKSDESFSNIYFVFLFITFLVVFILFLVVFIYYCHKDNTNNISKKLYGHLSKYKILNHIIFK